MRHLPLDPEYEKEKKFYESMVKYAIVLVVGVVLGYAWCWNALN